MFFIFVENTFEIYWTFATLDGFQQGIYIFGGAEGRLVVDGQYCLWGAFWVTARRKLFALRVFDHDLNLCPFWKGHMIFQLDNFALHHSFVRHKLYHPPFGCILASLNHPENPTAAATFPQTSPLNGQPRSAAESSLIVWYWLSDRPFTSGQPGWVVI